MVTNQREAWKQLQEQLPGHRKAMRRPNQYAAPQTPSAAELFMSNQTLVPDVSLEMNGRGMVKRYKDLSGKEKAGWEAAAEQMSRTMEVEALNQSPITQEVKTVLAQTPRGANGRYTIEAAQRITALSGLSAETLGLGDGRASSPTRVVRPEGPRLLSKMDIMGVFRKDNPAAARGSEGAGVRQRKPRKLLPNPILPQVSRFAG